MDFTKEVLKLFSENDLNDFLMWYIDPTSDEDNLILSMNCNDCFYWGTSDDEEITPETFDVLKQSIEDIKAIDDELGMLYVNCLYAARVRGMRPQGAAYPVNEDAIPNCKEIWKLFDACGPEREESITNPFSVQKMVEIKNKSESKLSCYRCQKVVDKLNDVLRFLDDISKLTLPKEDIKTFCNNLKNLIQRN